MGGNLINKDIGWLTETGGCSTVAKLWKVIDQAQPRVIRHGCLKLRSSKCIVYSIQFLPLRSCGRTTADDLRIAQIHVAPQTSQCRERSAGVVWDLYRPAFCRRLHEEFRLLNPVRSSLSKCTFGCSWISRSTSTGSRKSLFRSRVGQTLKTVAVNERSDDGVSF